MSLRARGVTVSRYFVSVGQATVDAFALHRKKSYGNKEQSEYVDWLSEFGEDFYWFNPAKLPSPIRWGNIRKMRVKDPVNAVRTCGAACRR